MQYLNIKLVFIISSVVVCCAILASLLVFLFYDNSDDVYKDFVIRNPHAKLYTLDNFQESSYSARKNLALLMRESFKLNYFLVNAAKFCDENMRNISTGDCFKLILGAFEKYGSNSDTPENGFGCIHLRNYARQIKSIDTEGSCVRVFSETLCRGWSQAFYPGSEVTVDSRIMGVNSVGPCVKSEFNNAVVKSFNNSPYKILTKVPNITLPDITLDHTRLRVYTSVSDKLHSITDYEWGHKQRLEVVLAKILPEHIRSREEAEKLKLEGQRKYFYNDLHLRETDQFGYAIPVELGGPVDERYNVFVQDEKKASEYEAFTIPLVKQFLNGEGSWVQLALNFIYENSTCTRPSGFWYHLHTNADGWKVFYGYVTN